MREGKLMDKTENNCKNKAGKVEQMRTGKREVREDIKEAIDNNDRRRLMQVNLLGS